MGVIPTFCRNPPRCPPSRGGVSSASPTISRTQRPMPADLMEPDAVLPPRAARMRVPAVVRALLRVPLFYKILIANGVLVLVGTIFGSTVTASYVRRSPDASMLVDVV